MTSHQENKNIEIGQLKNISTWVSSVQDLNQLLDLILHTGTRIMRAKASSLVLLDQKTQKLYFKVTTGSQKDKMKNFEISLGQGIVGFGEDAFELRCAERVEFDAQRKASLQFGDQVRRLAVVKRTGGNEQDMVGANHPIFRDHG